MQLLTYLLPLIPLLTLANADACVAGGPTNQVTAAKGCCFSQSGTWYQFYDNQAICVLDAGSHTTWYLKCIGNIPYSLLDTTCIPGDGGLGVGSSTSATGRITFTATGTAPVGSGVVTLVTATAAAAPVTTTA